MFETEPITWLGIKKLITVLKASTAIFTVMQYTFTLVKKDYSQCSLMHGAHVKATIFISFVSGSVYLNMTFHN